MKRMAAMVFVVLIALSVSGAAGRVQDRSTWAGEGTRLGFFFPPFSTHVREISTSEASFFDVGWWEPVYPGWQNDMRDYYGEKVVVGGSGPYVFLWIDGQRVKLNHESFWEKYSVLGPDPKVPFEIPGDTDCKVLKRYFQFPPGYFSPGTYEITWEISHRNPQHIFWLLGPGQPIVGTTILTVHPD